MGNWMLSSYGFYGDIDLECADDLERDILNYIDKTTKLDLYILTYNKTNKIKIICEYLLNKKEIYDNFPEILKNKILIGCIL